MIKSGSETYNISLALTMRNIKKAPNTTVEKQLRFYVKAYTHGIQTYALHAFLYGCTHMLGNVRPGKMIILKYTANEI